MATILKNCWGKGGAGADGLFTHPRALEQRFVTGRILTWRQHPFLGLSFSISRA